MNQYFLLIFSLLIVISGNSLAEERRLQIPIPVFFMYGYNDINGESRKPEWEKVIDIFNVIDGKTDNAEFVKQLRSKGKIFAYHVSFPTKIEDYNVENIVKSWSEPFENTLNGKLPGGFDAICIDEFHSFPDGSKESIVSIEVLKQIREKYKDRLIFASGVWRLGHGGLTSIRSKGKTYDDILNAINKYADIFILENYHRTVNPHLSFFDSMAHNIKDRVPGLIAKTIYALYISQNLPGDDQPGVDFYKFLEKQVDIIKSNPVLNPMKGVAFWVFYRAKPETIDTVIDLVKKISKDLKNSI